MEERMNRAYLVIGGNMGARAQLLARARLMIEAECGSVLRQSSVYETEAWGKTDQPSFLNQVLELDTHLSPDALLAAVLAIETKMGRVRQEKYGPRLMDIDILFYENSVIATRELTIPHPHLAQRRFVLAPLAELVPDHLHPILKIPVKQMLAACTDPLDVHKL